MRSLLVVPLLAVLGCGSSDQYVYAPETANAQQQGMPASRTAIPPEQPQGSVLVTSSGVTRITPQGQPPIDAIHVRMAVSNDGDPVAWNVDTRNQLLEIPGEGQARPLFANSDLRTLPMVAIPQGQKHVIDLFYPLPASVGESKLPQFDLVWRVDTGARTVVSRTAFDREEVAPDYYASSSAYGLYDYGYGYPYWWYDPLWAGGVVWFHPRHFFVGPGLRGGVRVGGFHGRFRAAPFHGGVAHGGGGARGHR